MGIFDFLKPPEKRPPTQEEVEAFTKGYRAERLKALRKQGAEAARRESEPSSRGGSFFMNMADKSAAMTEGLLRAEGFGSPYHMFERNRKDRKRR